MVRTLLVGTEARVDPRLADPTWDAARRETYLLRRDVERPLSVDPAVWPSGPPPAVTVVIGLVIETSNDEALAAGQGIADEVVVDAGWQCLGFDVADGAISGLSNCGYDADEVGALRERWAARLNAHGLFDDVEEALAFRALADTRVREHAPFAVVAMWLVAM